MGASGPQAVHFSFERKASTEVASGPHMAEDRLE